MTSDTYFLQYWTTEPWVVCHKDKEPAIHLHNGFSSAYENLKHFGDFLWHKSGSKLTLTSGKVYASLMYGDNVENLMEAARNNPDLEIHVGGPLISVNDIKKDPDVPNFITHPNIMVEELFDLKHDPYAWGLPIPKLPVGFPIAYNFGAVHGTGCPWAKCTFCKCQRSTSNYEELARLKRDVPVINYFGHKDIWVRSASMEPAFLDKMPYREDVTYHNYLRGDWVNYGKLVHANLHPGMLFSLGVEIPSNRMLKKLKKGTSTSSIRQTIKLLNSEGCRIHINLMLGFNDFKWEDVQEISEWLNLLSQDVNLSDITATIYHLIIVPGREIFENPPGMIEKYDTYKSYLDLPGIYKCVLDDRQLAMNDAIHKLYYESGLHINNDRYEGGK